MKKKLSLIGNFPSTSISDISFDIMRRIFFVEAFRLGIYTLITLLFLFFQIKQALFTSLSIIVPTYSVLGIGFCLNTIYLFLYDKVSKAFLINAMSVLFFFDVVLISTLLHITGLSQPLFVFLYLINIILCGLVFKNTTTIWLALFTSFSFCILMILSPNTEGIGVILGINNLAFFTVAFLTNFLSGHIGILDSKIADQTDEISSLKNLNKQIIDSVPSGIIVFENSGHIIYRNDIVKNLGFTKKNVFLTFNDLKDHLISKVYANEDICTWEEVHKFKDEDLILGLSLVPLRAEQNNHLMHVLIVQDLTKIKQLEATSRQKEKLAAIGTLASRLAHEIKNPLTGISGSVQMLKANDLKKEDKKMFDIILNETDRLNKLLNNFLNYAKPTVSKKNKVNLTGIMREVLVMMKSNNDKIKQKVQLEPSTGVVGDPDKLKQVFYNLFLNAYQAMESRDDGTLDVRSYVDNKKLYVVIKDTGPGIPKEILDRIFEPFVTTKSSGTGLGLATVYNILQSHDAKINVTSNNGTEFVIVFTQLCKFDGVLDIGKIKN